MPSSMHVNMIACTLRGVGKFMNNRGDFAQNRGGYVDQEGRGRQFGRRFYYQVCGKLEHFVDRCYHCFDRNF